MAMTAPGNHCIGEYAIPYRNAISVNAGLSQCCSISYPQGYAALTLGCLALAAPLRGLFYGKPTFYPDIEFCINILFEIFYGMSVKNIRKIP